MYDKFMLDNVGIDYLISSIANSLRINYIIKLLYNKNVSNLEISKIIGKKEFFIKKSLERLYQYTLDDLGNYINKLYMKKYIIYDYSIFSMLSGANPKTYEDFISNIYNLKKGIAFSEIHARIDLR